MKLSEIAWQRFHQQGLLQPRVDSPAEVIRWNGALQAQDYAGAKWAVAQRISHVVSDANLDQAYDEGHILRTHVMRPTWHFVTPADIRWLLQLTAPRVHQANAYYYRTLGLDAATFAKSNAAIARALEGGNLLTRAGLGEHLHRAGIDALDLRLTYLVMHAELEGVICSGPRHGKQFTYALLDERVPPAPALTDEAALAELTRRYFVSHGPALLKDFVWWSGLTVTEAKTGIELLRDELQHEVIQEQNYWFSPTPPPAMGNAPRCHLLPNYDEALASYKDYSAATTPEYAGMWSNGESVFAHYITINGVTVGTWRRTLTKRTVTLETKLFRPLTAPEPDALNTAAQQFGDFLGLKVDLQLG